MKAALLLICLSSALAQSEGNSSVHVQPADASSAEQAKDAGSDLFTKLKNKMGDVKEKIKQGIAAIRPSPPTPAVNDLPAQLMPITENGQMQAQAPSGFVQGMQNFMTNLVSNMKNTPTTFPFLTLNDPGSPAALLGNVSKEGLEDLKNMTQGIANYTMAEMKDKMAEWATKYGVKEQLDKFETECESKKTEVLANVTTTVNFLPSRFQELVSIVQNKNQTIPEFTNAINAYFQSLEPTEKHIISNIVAATGMDMLLFIPKQLPGARPLDSFKMFKGINEEEHRPNLPFGAIAINPSQMRNAMEGSKSQSVALPSVGNNVRKEDMTTKVLIA